MQSAISRNVMNRIILFASFMLVLTLAPLTGVTFSGNSGFYIPVGTWADHHSPSPFLSLGVDLYEKGFATMGIALELASFRGKVNNNYHLQIISPAATVKLYPLFSMRSRGLFLKGTLTYSFMQRNLDEATEKGRDFGVLSSLGFEFSIAEKWRIIPHFGEKHYFGGIDMFVFGLEIAFRK
jgi:hypothetical protein